MARQQEQVEMMERGNIYFVYRPKVQAVGEEHAVKGFKEVQRFYMILSPERAQSYRLITIGPKQLPDIEDGSEKNWAFVDMVARDAREIEDELQRDTYETKTRGERVRPAARPAGEGVYALVDHGDHTHLVYALELPNGPGEVQQALNIAEEASYIISVKNPEKPSPGRSGLSEERKVELPGELQERFRDRRFISVNPPDFLDYAGTELLFVGAAGDISEELGITLDTQDEDEHTAEIFRELHMARSRHPVKPLLQGEWE